MTGPVYLDVTSDWPGLHTLGHLAKWVGGAFVGTLNPVLRHGWWLSLCAASRMWVRLRSVLIVPPEGGLEFSAGLTKKMVFLLMSRLTNNSGLYYKIVIESWIAHASSSSHKVLLRKTVARGSREERERSQSVPLTLPASYSLFSRAGFTTLRFSVSLMWCFLYRSRRDSDIQSSSFSNCNWNSGLSFFLISSMPRFSYLQSFTWWVSNVTRVVCTRQTFWRAMKLKPVMSI